VVKPIKQFNVLTGDFDLNEISILTDKMKIPGGDELKSKVKQK
jgi:hypothetical protein